MTRRPAAVVGLCTVGAQTLRDLSGALTSGVEAAEETQLGLRSAELIGEGADVVGHSEARKRFPKYQIKDDEIAIVDHGAGTIFPEKTIRTAVAAAKNRGAIVRTETGSTTSVSTARWCGSPWTDPRGPSTESS